MVYISTVYKATIDSSGNAGTFSTTSQGQLPQTIGLSTPATVSVGGTNYLYVIGGYNGSIRSTVYKAQIANPPTVYTATKTISSQDLSSKNYISWNFYSSLTGSYMVFEFSEDGSTWQTCTFSVSSANTWEQNNCDISGITSTARDAITQIRFRTTDNTTAFTAYFDNIKASAVSFGGLSPTSSNTSAVLGANNLAVNAQGTGLVQINYAASTSPQAGSGGMTVYNGGTTPWFTIDSGGNVGIGTSTPTAKMQIQGNVGIGYTGVVIPANGLAVSGNLGIGTTTANSNLSVAGSAHIGTIRQGIAAPTNGLFVDGNVGIGATTSSNMLDVWGNSRLAGTLAVDSTGTLGNALIGYSGVTAPSRGLAVSGNVGVGTTSPQGALHVVGQCVAWDSKIRIRKRRKKGGGEDDILEYDYLEVMIKDILPGDEVLSLNEYTAKLEYQRIEKLLDMGSKGVYELTTKSGRKIKTTGNHPYLVLLRSDLVKIEYSSPIKNAGWVKVINLQVGDAIAVAGLDSAKRAGLLFGSLFTKGYIGQSKSNNQESKSNYCQTVNVSKIHESFFLNQYAKSNASIPAAISSVKIEALSITSMPGKIGETIAKPNQKTDRLINQSASTESNVEPIIGITQNYNIEGTGFQWDTITSIKYLGYEHVYDLQIENTHNFLANDIVAHNTYINGNLGIGTYSGLTVPTNGLAVSGNIGIGTTTANSNLSIAGNTHIGSLYQGISAPTNGLFVDGNVGIGATTSSNKLDVWGNSRLAGNLTVDSTGTLGNALIGYSGVTAPSRGLAVQGNVGIGTTSPTDLLQVQGTGSMPSLLVTVAGNVGIGTSVTSNPLTVGIDGSTGNGASLTTGGVWTNGSSREFKENFVSLDPQLILAKINSLPLTQWNYKLEGSSVQHIGPIAEDFYSIFGLGNDNKHISTVDPAGISLLGIQALSYKVDALGLSLSSLQGKIASLSAQTANTPTQFTLSEPEASRSATASAQIATDTAQPTPLNLTPPEALLASGSAALTNLTVKSEATISGVLTAYEGIFQTTLKSLGKTLLGNTLVAGSLTIDGTMNISGNSLSSPGTLFLQNEPLAKSVDFLNGIVQIDNLGNINTQGEITTAKINITKAAGQAVLKAGQKQVSIEAPQTTANSLIFLTPATLTDKVLSVTAKLPGVSFTVEIKNPTDVDITFNWWIIN